MKTSSTEDQQQQTEEAHEHEKLAALAIASMAATCANSSSTQEDSNDQEVVEVNEDGEASSSHTNSQHHHPLHENQTQVSVAGRSDGVHHDDEIFDRRIVNASRPNNHLSKKPSQILNRLLMVSNYSNPHHHSHSSSSASQNLLNTGNSSDERAQSNNNTLAATVIHTHEGNTLRERSESSSYGTNPNAHSSLPSNSSRNPIRTKEGLQPRTISTDITTPFPIYHHHHAHPPYHYYHHHPYYYPPYPSHPPLYYQPPSQPLLLEETARITTKRKTDSDTDTSEEKQSKKKKQHHEDYQSDDDATPKSHNTPHASCVEETKDVASTTMNSIRHESSSLSISTRLDPPSRPPPSSQHYHGGPIYYYHPNQQAPPYPYYYYPPPNASTTGMPYYPPSSFPPPPPLPSQTLSSSQLAYDSYANYPPPYYAYPYAPPPLPHESSSIHHHASPSFKARENTTTTTLNPDQTATTTTSSFATTPVVFHYYSLENSSATEPSNSSKDSNELQIISAVTQQASPGRSQPMNSTTQQSFVGPPHTQEQQSTFSTTRFHIESGIDTKHLDQSRKRDEKKKKLEIDDNNYLLFEKLREGEGLLFRRRKKVCTKNNKSADKPQNTGDRMYARFPNISNCCGVTKHIAYNGSRAGKGYHYILKYKPTSSEIERFLEHKHDHLTMQIICSNESSQSSLQSSSCFSPNVLKRAKAHLHAPFKVYATNGQSTTEPSKVTFDEDLRVVECQFRIEKVGEQRRGSADLNMHYKFVIRTCSTKTEDPLFSGDHAKETILLTSSPFKLISKDKQEDPCTSSPHCIRTRMHD